MREVRREEERRRGGGGSPRTTIDVTSTKSVDGDGLMLWKRSGKVGGSGESKGESTRARAGEVSPGADWLAASASLALALPLLPPGMDSQWERLQQTLDRFPWATQKQHECGMPDKGLAEARHPSPPVSGARCETGFPVLAAKTRCFRPRCWSFYEFLRTHRSPHYWLSRYAACIHQVCGSRNSRPDGAPLLGAACKCPREDKRIMHCQPILDTGDTSWPWSSNLNGGTGTTGTGQQKQPAMLWNAKSRPPRDHLPTEFQGYRRGALQFIQRRPTYNHHGALVASSDVRSASVQVLCSGEGREAAGLVARSSI